MYNMKTETFTKKSDGELVAGIAEKREMLRAFRFGTAGSKSKNVREGREVRRTIARMLTEQSARRMKA